jgi:hypothetical protein
MNRAPSGAIGVALSARRIVVTSLARDARARATAFEASWDADASDRFEVLMDALRRAKLASPAAREVHIALAGALADVRVIVVPRLAAEELRPAIARDLVQYVPSANAQSVVQLHDSADASGTGRLLSSASAELVADIRRAASEAGLALRSIVAAPLPWRAAIVESSRAAGVSGWFHFTCDDTTTALHVLNGALVAIRRASVERRALLPPGQAFATDESAALRLAAEHAHADDADSLWPDEVYAERTRRVWRQAIGLAVASFVLLVAAAGLEWRAITRAEASLATVRDSLRPALDAVMARRESSATIGSRVRAIEGFEQGAPRWLDLLAAVDRTLPADASLQSLRASADTLLLTGQAQRAAPVLRAFSESPRFDGARTDAPIDQVVENGEVVAERFTIIARPRGRTP